MTDGWEAFLRKLTLERHTGMPRWNLTAAPERADVWDDSSSVVAQRRKVLEELEAEERMQRHRLRRVA